MNFWVSQFILTKSEKINENNGFFKTTLSCLAEHRFYISKKDL